MDCLFHRDSFVRSMMVLGTRRERAGLLFNDEWRQRGFPDVFYGVADGSVTPGDLRPESSLLLGEIEEEALFALDYRATARKPSVVFLNMSAGLKSRRTLMISGTG